MILRACRRVPDRDAQLLSLYFVVNVMPVRLLSDHSEMMVLQLTF